MASAAHRDNRSGVILTRTRGEWFRVILTALVACGGGTFVAGALVWWLVRAANTSFKLTLPVAGLGAVTAVAVAVGLGGATTFGLLTRPRVLRTRDAGGAGRHSGNGDLWAGPRGPVPRGATVHNVATLMFGLLFASAPPVYPAVTSFFDSVQGMFLTVIVPAVVGLFVAVFGIRWAIYWIHGAVGGGGRHAGSMSAEFWSDREPSDSDVDDYLNSYDREDYGD